MPGSLEQAFGAAGVEQRAYMGADHDKPCSPKQMPLQSATSPCPPCIPAK